MPEQEAGVAIINRFHPLAPDSKVVAIGCGYGRETLKITPIVNRMYGIDVSKKILDKAVNFLGTRNVHNFTPVLADNYKMAIPDSIDVVLSIVVMQRLTRDLAGY